MPELPEVETVRKTLLSWCKDKRILGVEFKYFKVLEGMDESLFKEKIINQKINDIDRIGKYLLFILDDYVLISHLRMEGKYFFVNNDETEYINKHKIVSFKLNDGNLIYHDVRKFGKMKLVKKNEYLLDESISKLGKEPFTITEKELYNKLHHLNKKIKQTLLDQSVIAGLGNIYVDEVLFDAKISPFRNSKDITIDECKKIIDSSIRILNRAIELKGSTIATYHFNNDESGGFQNEHKVYGKKGYKCYNCDNLIEKSVVGGRGTYYCTNCQK